MHVDDCRRERELRESVKIVKLVEGKCKMRFRAKSIAYSSVVKTLASGGRQYW